MDEDNPFTKAQTIDPEVRAYVYSLVNALGGTSGDIDGRYVLGDDALAVLRDLKRWLKLYDEKTNRLDVARCLAEAKLVTGDLLPILASWTEDGKNDRLRSRMSLACLELLVPLTWPLEHGEMTVNHHRHTPYLQQAQVLYKAGILNWDNTNILRQAIRIALPSIALRRDERTTRDEGIIKLMLYFVRNVSVIRQIPNLPSQGLENEVSRSATIEAFRAQDVFAVLLTMCSNMGEDFNLQDVIILEILFNLIKGVDVNRLWMTEAQRKGQEVSDLKATLNEERSLHKDAKKNEPSRHGRFGTMIWLKRAEDKVSTISGQDNLRGDNRNALLNIDKTKKWSKPQQKRKDMDHTIYDFDRQTHLTSSASEKLRNFVEEFLDSGFNPLVSHLRKAIEREAERMLDVNYRQFFYVVSWFLQAERVRRTRDRKEIKPTDLNEITTFEPESFGLVAAVLNQETFITLNRYMQNSLDNKEWQDLNASMRCFTQILYTVQEMTQSPLEEDQEIAENIQNRIFYEEATHDRIASIVRGYKDQGFGYLDACTELSHVFLRMLERYSKENADLQIKSRRRRASNKKKKNQEAKKQARLEGREGERDDNQDHGREEDDDDDDVDSENEDIADIAQVARERKFDFKRFAAKFTSQSAVDTFVTFTTFFRELSTEQLKRAHRFFYRVAFKQELAILLYRVDIIALFYKMIQGPEGLSRKHPMYAEFSEFSKQVFRKMFKKLEQRPELLVEMLFSKINKTLYYLEYGHDKVATTSNRAPAELEVKPSATRDRTEQIGIVVTILVKDEKTHLVSWVKNVLGKAFDERSSWKAEAEARQAAVSTDAEAEGEQGTTRAQNSPPPHITIRPIDAEVQTAMFKNSRLKLLMKLVDFEASGQDDVLDATWIIPSQITSQRLSESKVAIEQFETDPWKPENPEDVPEDLLRRVRQVVPRSLEEDEEARRDAFIDDSEGDENPNLDEEFMFPDNIRGQSKPKRNFIEELKAKRRQKRKRDESDDGEDDGTVDDELAAKRRQLREEAALERRRKIKSELYIRDSDDETDEERDRDFFAREETNRRKQDETVRSLMAKAREANNGTGPKRTSKGRDKRDGQNKKRKVTAVGENDNSDDDGDTRMTDHDDEVDTATSSSQSLGRRDDRSDVSDEDRDDNDTEETPLSSPHVIASSPVANALKEIAQPRVASSGASNMVGKDAVAAEIELDNSSDDEEIVRPDVVTAAATVKRRMRGGFVIDSDSDGD